MRRAKTGAQAGKQEQRFWLSFEAAEPQPLEPLMAKQMLRTVAVLLIMPFFKPYLPPNIDVAIVK